MSYDFSWHKDHGQKTSSSAIEALKLLREVMPFETVLDVGCGDGRWLNAAAKLGATEIQGVDGPWTELDKVLIPSDKIKIQHLDQPVVLDRRFDLAISLEVAEHVAKPASKTFVRHLTEHSDLVLFGAAIPNQGGYRHINEQWQSYWAKLFAKEGFRPFDLLRDRLWNHDEVHFWYAQNMLVYVRESNEQLVDEIITFIGEAGINQLPLDIVHPRLFDPIANYRQIAFKPLLKQLPHRTIQKAQQVMFKGI